MSHDNGPSTIKPSKGGGGGWKWLAALGAAAVVLGGGYYAWKSMGPAQPTQSAYNETIPADPYASSNSANQSLTPPPSDSAVTDEGRATESTPSVATTRSTRTSQSRAAQTRTARAEPVPLTTVGITPTNDTMQEEEVVVQGHRQPVWTRAPNATRLSAFYPARAIERRREGEAQVHCTVVDNGALDCVKVSEFPANSGFGTAAMHISRMFRHARQRADGSSAIGTPVDLRVVFRMGDDNRG